MSVSLTTINTITEMKKELFTQKDIAELLNISESTVSRVLSEKTGKKQRAIADRMEYFMGGAIKGTGCYENGREIIEFTDITYEEASLAEMLENIETIKDL